MVVPCPVWSPLLPCHGHLSWGLWTLDGSMTCEEESPLPGVRGVAGVSRTLPD